MTDSKCLIGTAIKTTFSFKTVSRSKNWTPGNGPAGVGSYAFIAKPLCKMFAKTLEDLKGAREKTMDKA